MQFAGQMLLDYVNKQGFEVGAEEIHFTDNSRKPVFVKYQSHNIQIKH